MNGSKFKKLVMFLAENSEKGNNEIDEEITAFEDAIKATGCGEAYFGTAKLDWDRIEIIRPEDIPFAYKKEGVKLYAEYYDGMQAPFTVVTGCMIYTEPGSAKMNIENYIKNRM